MDRLAGQITLTTLSLKTPPDYLFASLPRITSKPLNTLGFYRGGSAYLPKAEGILDVEVNSFQKSPRI